MPGQANPSLIGRFFCRGIKEVVFYPLYRGGGVRQYVFFQTKPFTHMLLNWDDFPFSFKRTEASQQTNIRSSSIKQIARSFFKTDSTLHLLFSVPCIHCGF